MTKKVTKSEVVAEDSGKKQALDLAIQQITKQFGTGAIMKLGDTQKIDVELLPSGSLSLDLALGGGYPKGRIIEIYGPESSGKDNFGAARDCRDAKTRRAGSIYRR